MLLKHEETEKPNPLPSKINWLTSMKMSSSTAQFSPKRLRQTKDPTLLNYRKEFTLETTSNVMVVECLIHIKCNTCTWRGRYFCNLKCKDPSGHFICQKSGWVIWFLLYLIITHVIKNLTWFFFSSKQLSS